jgi:hypothetical protein
MYIIAELHPMYGAFKQIQQDNYPFKRAFESYLVSISQLGMTLKLPVDLLVGVIEDSLIEGRLPNIPYGDEAIKFKFTIDQPVVETYFDSTFGRMEKPLKHKRSILLLIRMTLRLSEVYGTSLSRLTARIERLRKELSEESAEEPVFTPKPATPKPISGRRVKLEPAIVDNVVDTVDNKEDEHTDTSSSVLKRLEKLTEEGDRLLHPEEEEPPVVETNPALADFFG